MQAIAIDAVPDLEEPLTDHQLQRLTEICTKRQQYSQLDRVSGQITTKALMQALTQCRLLVGFDVESTIQVAMIDALRERYCEADIYQAFREMRFDEVFASDINLARNRLRLPYIVKYLRMMVPENAIKIGEDEDGNSIWGRRP